MHIVDLRAYMNKFSLKKKKNGHFFFLTGNEEKNGKIAKIVEKMFELVNEEEWPQLAPNNHHVSNNEF